MSTGIARNATTPATAAAYDVERVRRDFPALRQQVHGHPLIYLDNAATTQKPQAVMDALQRFYLEECSNIHRGVHYLSQQATEDYEATRSKARRFLNARQNREILFVRGTTEALNLVAHSFARPRLRSGDEVLITHMEHHSNIVPWQILCQETGARLRVAPINDAGELIVEEFEKLLGPRTRVVSLAYVSNALGTINPVRELVRMAHARNVPVVLDGAQAAPHLKVDVQELDCDFFTLSGHKMYAPTGIGVLYGKAELLEEMPPYQGGGDMIRSVTFEKTLYNELPFKFEAGTPNIAGTIGLGAAMDYLEELGRENIAAYEQELLDYGTRALSRVPGLRMIGTAREKAAVLSFDLPGVHPHDVGTILDREGIAVRTGHHCAQPVMDRFGVPATSRASLGVYNTREELDALAAGLRKVTEIFGR
ncbi:cysteine desulfurase [Acidobacteriia bacterium AH_259_A11_L15]|nr:cysteine desulfurase [Acidobacteriia bacterium AH_259_A11_L15]